MNITKLGHCCLLIEHKEKRILTDPGEWSDTQNLLTDVDLVLITHEHADHLHVESLETILQNNPQAKIITNSSVAKLLGEKGFSYDIVEHGQQTDFESILIEAFGTEHAEIYGDFGLVQNTGYFVDNILFYPGDAFTDPQKPVDILPLPVVGPWTSLKMSIDYALKIHPRVVFPVHDAHLHINRQGPIHRLPFQILSEHNISFVPLQAGESFDSESI